MHANEFTPWDFAKLVKNLCEHEAGLKIKLAKAEAAEATPEDQTSSVSRP